MSEVGENDRRFSGRWVGYDTYSQFIGRSFEAKCDHGEWFVKSLKLKSQK